MIADYADNMYLYDELREYEEIVLEFIKRQAEEKLPEGRYDLEKGVFALVQIYNTKYKEGAQMESHRKYCDLQYIAEGTEKIYWESIRNLAVTDDKTPEADIIFYECGTDKGYTLLQKGMFGYYTPKDGHMPCIAANGIQKMKKIVFKIPVRA